MAIRLAEPTADTVEPVQYALRLDDQEWALNPYIGQFIQLHFNGHIACVACGRTTKKSYAQGHCYPCMQKLASCDLCIMKPEICHHHLGTCRQPDWGQQHCMVPHYVYLANTSGVKVGITRHTQLPTRWLDQGATEAMPLLKVATRRLSGLVEIAIAEHVADKTNWRAMLKGDGTHVNLAHQGQELLSKITPKLNQLREDFGPDSIEVLTPAPMQLHYPVQAWPTKISSHNFDKNPTVNGVLKGIKGQYLILDTGVINLRKFSGYNIAFQGHCP